MRRSSQNNQKVTYTSSCTDNYIAKCWDEFTTLTSEEEQILTNIVGFKPMVKRGGQKRKVYDHLTNKVYGSLRECALNIGISPTSVNRCLQEGTKTKKGHYFSYIDE